MKLNAVEFDKIACEVFAPVYPIIAEQIKHKTGINKGTCLDVGSGSGYLGIALARITDLHISLLDKSKEMLEIAVQNIASCGLEARIQTLLGDAQEIPLNDKSIDLVVSRGSIFFWENQQKAFKEIYRVLTPGGAAYIGGGFGTAELKKEIISKMEKRDRNWQEKINRNIGKNAIETFEKILKQAEISTFEITRDEAGLWIIIRR